MRRTKFMKIVLLLVIGYLTVMLFRPVIISKWSYPSANQKTKFARSLEPFPWDLFNETAFESNSTNHYVLAEELVNQLVPFVTMEPLQPINETCKPQSFKRVNCSKLLESPRKVAVLLQFGFDVDNLEIHLNELDDIVDRFFILESYRTHFGALKKPLVWEVVKNQVRFQKFKPKIVHFILDDSEMIGVVKEGLDQNRTTVVESTSSDFGMETLQEGLRWEKFTAWNNRTRYFGDEDLVGIGDTDEIPSREVINHLKQCEFENDPVDIGIWFPFGNINQAYKTDWPVSNEHPFTLGDPTYWKLKTGNVFRNRNVSGNNSERRYPTRNRGSSPSYRLGGMHMTHYGYLPYQIIKRITQSERSVGDVHNITKLIQDHLQPFGITLFELERVLAAVPTDYKQKMFYLDALRRAHAQDIDEVAVLPWFYDCNRLRYPSWEGGHDTRLD